MPLISELERSYGVRRPSPAPPRERTAHPRNLPLSARFRTWFFPVPLTDTCEPIRRPRAKFSGIQTPRERLTR